MSDTYSDSGIGLTLRLGRRSGLKSKAQGPCSPIIFERIFGYIYNTSPFTTKISVLKGLKKIDKNCSMIFCTSTK